MDSFNDAVKGLKEAGRGHVNSASEQQGITCSF